MLSFFFFTSRFLKFIQSGCYVDFFFKKIIESFVKNIFVYTSQFFGEKYFIEYLTKKIIDKVIFNNNSFFLFFELNFGLYFIQTVSFLLYSLFFLNFFFLLY